MGHGCTPLGLYYWIFDIIRVKTDNRQMHSDVRCIL